MEALHACIAASVASALAAGTAGAVGWQQLALRKKRHGRLHAVLGMKDRTERTEVAAAHAWFVRLAEKRSREAQGRRRREVAGRRHGGERLADAIAKAGLRDRVTFEGLQSARRTCLLWLVAAGALIGSVFSLPLALLAAAGALLYGWMLPRRALKALSVMRKRHLEGSLSQTLEVLCLGLRAGLSFDRALALYCKSFEGTFSRELLQCLHLWQAGIVSREGALRSLAATYESPLLERVVDNIVRSLRFGTPLADSLEVLALESRTAHTAQVQEAVMKAPVKMMVPVGALILPSMLLLVLGPVLLDLINGF